MKVPYIIHPLYVGIILADLEMDTNSIIAGILHDIIEDTDLTYDNLKEMFNQDVADIVEGVTKLSRMEIGNRDKMDEQAENLRKMFLATRMKGKGLNQCLAPMPHLYLIIMKPMQPAVAA